MVLNRDLDLTICTPEQGSVFAMIPGPGKLQYLIRRLPKACLIGLLNFKPRYNSTPLYKVACMGLALVVLILLDAGANIEFEGGTRGTALIGACDAGRLDTTALLVRLGAKSSYTNSAGELVTAIAPARIHPEIVRWFLVSRYTGQRKICNEADITTKDQEVADRTGVLTLEKARARTAGVSWLKYLVERERARRGNFGKVYFPS